MIERCLSVRLLHEAPHPILIRRDLGRQNFQRGFAMQTRVFRQIHLTHSAFANFRADFVATEFCASGESHRFKSAVQFMTTVSGEGADSSTRVLTRKRWPSALTT